jgi:cytochrome c
MKLESITFTSVLGLIGLVLLTFVLLHLGLRGLHRHPVPPEWEIPDSDPQRGRTAIQMHGCGACHTIPGIRGANGRVGPQLHGFRNQIYIAGMLPNIPENLIFWIQHPREVNPATAMPDLQVSEEEARDIAAYLYSVR